MSVRNKSTDNRRLSVAPKGMKGWHGQTQFVRVKGEHGQSSFVRGTGELDFFMRGGTDKKTLSVEKESTDNFQLSVAPKKQSPQRAIYEIRQSEFHQRKMLQYFLWISRTLATAPSLLGELPTTRSMLLGSTRDSPQSSCMSRSPHSLIPLRL